MIVVNWLHIFFTDVTISRQCGINPGECFSQVTMQIQSIGVSSFQSASTLAYNDALSCSITCFSKMTTNTYTHTYMTSQNVTITSNNTVSTVASLSQEINEAEPVDQLQVNFVVVSRVFQAVAAVAAMARVQGSLTVEEEREVYTQQFAFSMHGFQRYAYQEMHLKLRGFTGMEELETIILV